MITSVVMGFYFIVTMTTRSQLPEPPSIPSKTYHQHLGMAKKSHGKVQNRACRKLSLNGSFHNLWGLGVPIRRIYEGFICLGRKIKIGSA